MQALWRVLVVEKDGLKALDIYRLAQIADGLDVYLERDIPKNDLK
jgi:hypothetical protein